MNARTLMARGVRHYWRTHLGVVLGVALATAVLVGALAVGDSVRQSLRGQALQRVGRIDAFLASGDRAFRSELAEAFESVTAAPVLQFRGVAARPDGTSRANGVQVLGVDEHFFQLGLELYGGVRPAPDQALINERLARQLGVAGGDRIVVRLPNPSSVPRDMVLSTTDDISLALRVEVVGVLPDDCLGRFDLAASQVPSFGVFLDLAWMQAEVGLDGRANLILAGANGARPGLADELTETLRTSWALADGQLEVRDVPGADAAEVRSARVFLDPPVAAAPALASEGAVRVLTYFVNELRVGERATPYSMVTAMDPGPASPVPAELGDDEVVINSWLADDLGASAGDELTLTYYVLGPTRRLVEDSARLRVHSVVPIEGPADDAELMPDFPGLSDAEHCRDWETGIPIDLERVRDEDEVYWDEHRGTPKAFVTTAAGQRMWGNRFGTLTAVRVAGAVPSELAATLRREVDPAAVGLFFRDLRGPALAASNPATDFGGLFLGLSFFLIAAALLLTSMLFVFGVEARAPEVGLLLALGFRPRRVRQLFLAEGGVLAVLGAVLGVPAGIGFTRAVLAGLASIWRDAVGATTIGLHVSPATLVGGALGAVVASLAAMVWVLRGQARRPAVELLGSRYGVDARGGGRVPLAATVAVVALLGSVGAIASGAGAGAFFGAGALLLVAGLAGTRVFLARLDRTDRPLDLTRLTVSRLGVRNLARRPGRSLATVALLAAGSFLVIAVGSNRIDPGDPTARSSGTGGFALFGRASLPVLHALDGEEGRDAFALDPAELEGVSVVPMRVREGDDASCLNLSLPQRPRLLGVRPELLADRGAFTFASTLKETADPWLLLDGGGDVVPAIGDQASVMWAMHKSLGDTLAYEDERGRPFEVRIVGTLAGSLLQGTLLIAEGRFEERFPSESGYRTFLVDAPPERAQAVSAHLSEALQDVGLELTPAAVRLEEFNAVQNTYLLVFAALGALGMLLGSVGLGIVVLRNALERRGELAIVRAVGFPLRAIRALLAGEHALLIALGLGLGSLSAALALLPNAAAMVEGSAYPVGPVLLIALSGVVSVWLATAVVVRGTLTDALRSE
jgi:ABC-type lipoprotein release transport system permease subunit